MSTAATAAAAAQMLGGCTATPTPSFFLSTTPTYRVHPLVVFSILDHYQRRNDGQTRVVGTLLGQQLDNGTVEVKQAFPVPHQEEEESVSEILQSRLDRCLHSIDLHSRILIYFLPFFQ
jgi:hypothetical protein